MTIRTDAINDALERLAGFAYLDAPGFATHGPMGAETLSALGHHDQVAAWADQYVRRHEPIPAPPAARPIDLADADATASALGDLARVSDWAEAFRCELTEQPWEAVLASWAPRLLPGHAGALTHGIIRTAHAVRALPTDEAPSDRMLDELAHGLALWAASYKVLPGTPLLTGPLSLDEATERLPRPEPPWALLDAGLFVHIGELEEFPDAVEALGPPESPEAALSLLSAQFCRVILAYPEVISAPLVHAVTPIGAVRTLQPYLPGASTTELFAHLWHVGAAITVAFTPIEATSIELEAAPPSPAELLARATEHGDPHVLKFSEAVTREHNLNPDPVYLAAAAHVINQLPSWQS